MILSWSVFATSAAQLQAPVASRVRVMVLSFTLVGPPTTLQVRVVPLAPKVQFAVGLAAAARPASSGAAMVLPSFRAVSKPVLPADTSDSAAANFDLAT